VSPLLPSLLACSGSDPATRPGPAPSATTVTSPDGVPWVVPGEDPAPVDLQVVLAAAQEGLELARTISPEPVLVAYRDLAAGADPGCPAMYEDDGLLYWLDSCTSGAGTTFDGFGLDDDLLVVDAYGTYEVTATGGAGSIEAPDGTFLEMDGYAQLVVTEDSGVFVSTVILLGDFVTNHPLADGTWLQQDLRPGLVTTDYQVLGTTLAFSAVGAIDGLGGEAPAVAFDDTLLVQEFLGYGGCSLEPTGAVSVRLAAGDWVDIVFDPTLEDDLVVYEPGTCDGCGTAWHRDTPLGEACLDFSSW
jgi:hypothetical protein